jgi:hypothetical protein
MCLAVLAGTGLDPMVTCTVTVAQHMLAKIKVGSGAGRTRQLGSWV